MFINWSPIRKLIWLKASGAIVPDLPWKTITGNPLSFIARTAHALKSCVVGIEPSQNLNGQANPYPPGGGKNLINNERYSSGSNVFFGGATSNAATSNPSIILPAGTYTLSVETADGTNTNLYARNRTTQVDIFAAYSVKSKSFTLTETTELILWAYKSGYSSADAIKTVQVESGSSATSYAPYSNICPISGFTGANVSKTGANLLDVSTNTLGYSINASGGFVQRAAGNYTALIPVTTGDKYIFIATSGTNEEEIRRIHGYNDSGTWVQQITYKQAPRNSLGDEFRISCTIPSGVTQIRVSYEKTATNAQFESVSTIQVSWNTEAGTVYGGSLDVTTGVLTVNMGYQDLGQLNWMYHSSGFFYNSYLPVKSGTINAICSMYPTGSGHGSAYITVNNTVIRIYDASKGTDPNAFKTAMSGVQFVYELATSQTYQLTAQEVSALVGENNMWTDCKTLTVEAKAL